MHASFVGALLEVPFKRPKASSVPEHILLEERSVNGTGVLVVVAVEVRAVVGAMVVVVVLVVAMVVVVVGSGMQDPDEHLPRAPFFVQIAPSDSGNVPPH